MGWPGEPWLQGDIEMGPEEGKGPGEELVPKSCGSGRS